MSEQQPSGYRSYLTINELSASTGFSVTQIRRLASAKKIPFFQPAGKGGKLLFPPDAIERSGSDDPSQKDQASDKPLSGRRPMWMNE